MPSIIRDTNRQRGRAREMEMGQHPDLLPPLSPSQPAKIVPSLVLSNSGKRFDQTAGKKKYVKQVTGRHKDTDLHLAAKSGDLPAVRRVFEDIAEQMDGPDLQAEMAGIQLEVVNEVNELGETALNVAAEGGHVEVVKELLKYSNKESVSRKNHAGFDAFHKAVTHGHQGIVQVLLNYDSSLSKTLGPSNTTPLVSAASRGHIGVVKELLSVDSSLLEISKTNGKNALHLAARQGHVEIVKALLEKDPQLAQRIDKKGQIALHMAVKGVSYEVVNLLIEADAALVMLPDKFGNTALHIATRKKRVEIVHRLLLLPDTNVNALTRDNKTALDFVEGLLLTEETAEIKECLARFGGVRAYELNLPRDELRKTFTQIKIDVHSQLEQTRRTYKNVHGIAKELRKLKRAGINNATNCVTVVAVLFATVAFAAIFTVPGGTYENGRAVVVSYTSFKIFFLFNAVSLFTSLAVVVVQITVVRGETKAVRQVVEVINKLMWLASICTTVSFIAASYIVVGRRNQWAAIAVTFIGGMTMVSLLGTMTYYVVKTKCSRKLRRRDRSLKRSAMSNSWHHHIDLSDSEINLVFAI